jgi:dynein heavy chain
MKLKDYIPIVRALCNPGLQDRHWKGINKAIGKEVGEKE